MWLKIYRQKLAMLAGAPDLGLVVFVSAAASWYAAGLMLRRIDSRPGWVWASIALIPAQFFILTRLPSLAELVGAVVGVVLLRVLGARPVGWWFVGLLVLRGLAPFHFVRPHAFSWVPFGGFLEMEWQAGIRVLLEKAWYFGAAIWLLRRDGTRRWTAVGLVTALALLVEAVQTVLPNRTPEITDPLLALSMGFAMYALRRNR
jgi:hypothetical protein